MSELWALSVSLSLSLSLSLRLSLFSLSLSLSLSLSDSISAEHGRQSAHYVAALTCSGALLALVPMRYAFLALVIGLSPLRPPPGAPVPCGR